REPGSSAPARLATGLLGVRGQLAFRRAVRLIGETQGRSGTAIRRRAQAETLLARLAARGPAARRSRAANLLGDLQLVDGLVDRANMLRYIGEAKDSFTDAVRLDPANRDAKYNLELLLTLLPRDRGGSHSQGRPGQAGQ